MKNGYVLLFVVMSSISYSQTIQETIGWINKNSQGRHKVLFIEKTNRIQLIKVDIIPGVIESAKVQEFNSKDVTMISAPTKNNEWNDLIFNFKKGGAEVTSFTIIDNSKTRSGESKKIVPGIVADIKSNEEMILNYKKAYLNLFKKIGVNIKDGDFYKVGVSNNSNISLVKNDKIQSSSKSNYDKLAIDKLLNSYKIHNQELLKQNEELKKENNELTSTIKEMTILTNRSAQNIEKTLETIKQKDLKISKMQDELIKRDSVCVERIKALKNKMN